ncbi:hypothetical protein DF142_31850 [Burkholderia cenocepacia]|uniref:hypothetical protein n=1 Tax=Burkholderia cenocepacia TaxID=95486 RepID=UPI000F578D7C|nr:hypothetical protein DF142_31850 [Burkholderia cenocepacia]RQU55205.1 hypothetical protein DF140_35030 [Burkholderia cenocepacia]
MNLALFFDSLDGAAEKWSLQDLVFDGRVGIDLQTVWQSCVQQASVERIDIPTHINPQGRWHYLAMVLDLFTRLVVGCAFSTLPDANLVVPAWGTVYEQHGKSVLAPDS